MKKIFKVLLLSVLMIMTVLLLSGCGGNKLTATKTTNDSYIGNYSEKIVVTFKDNKATTIEQTIDFDNEASAESMYSMYNIGSSIPGVSMPDGIDVKLNGKTMTITTDANVYASSNGLSNDGLTKEAMKASYEENGYTVK